MAKEGIQPEISFIARPLGYGPGLILNATFMTWQPKHLIEGRLDNRTPGKVTGWLRFYLPHRRWRERNFWVTLDLAGDFHEDVRGTVLWLLPDLETTKPKTFGPECAPEGLAPLQRGVVGDITAGLPLGRWTEEVSQAVLARQELHWDHQGFCGPAREARRREVLSTHRQQIEARVPFYPFTSFPYVEWFSEANGRVVLDPGAEVDVHAEWNTYRRRQVKTPEELCADERRRTAAFSQFISAGTIVQ